MISSILNRTIERMAGIMMSGKAQAQLARMLLAVVLLGTQFQLQAAQQFQGLCSYIRIEIQQELALERVGFLATLEVTNNEGDAVITDFSSALTFTKEVLDDQDNVINEDVSDLFFVKPPTLTGINDIDGLGIIEPGETARVEWFIIPKISAGGDSQVGIQYEVGAELAGSLYGDEIDPAVLEVIPDTITVKPEPQLDITYFQPRDVDGDNPFTPDVVETPIPFTLGVLVKNVGYGQANKVTVDSEQPKIVENLQNLLVVPKLLGARISDEPLSGTPSLTLNLGDIPPQDCKKGAWDMITTLSGEFTEFNARYTHADELGGEATSVIKSINAYFMVREVLNDQPGRDSLYDFLATTDDEQEDLIPDTLFESDCNTIPVNLVVDPLVVSYNGSEAVVRANFDIENWSFMRVDDPAQDRYPIESVVRSDGKVLNPRNYWTNTRYDPQTNDELNYLNIFDYVGSALGEYNYTVSYAAIAGDSTPPVTTLQFSGQHEEASGVHYVGPETQMFFVAQDASPVASYYCTNPGADPDNDKCSDLGIVFDPAYPFKLDVPGTYQLEYYSEDNQGNVEAFQSTTIVLVGDYPSVTDYQSNVDEVLLAGDVLSVRPTDIEFSVVASSDSATLSARAEVYRGVYAWPTLQGIPSSPTRLATASITVAGNNVDFYQYRINGSAWSAETPVAQTIELTGLSAGLAVLDVRARNDKGVYLSDSTGTLTVSWQVDPAAPPTTVTSTVTHPTNLGDGTFNVSGVDLYRYTIDAGYYRAEAAISEPFSFERLSEGPHVVSVIGKTAAGDWQDEANASEISWTIDRSYGYDIDQSHLVYEQDLGAVTGLTTFNWDGHAQNGSPVAPGWYTVKLILTDGLNRTTEATRLVQVGDLLPDTRLMVELDNARQSEVHGRGNWVVWQDQRSGSWNIYAKDIISTGAVETQVTDSTLNQERPRTDGEYVVWQARQADGSLDIMVSKLGDATPAASVTSTPGIDEIKPVVEWPWVIYQRKPNNDADAPWQLFAKNLTTDTETAVDVTTFDQLDPSIHEQRIVWQDHRDVGPGEIYFKHLQTGDIRRITDQTDGQYHPVIEDQWIVWADNRATQFDLYAYNLYRDITIQLTSTPEDETRPGINDQWVVYEEDSVGEQLINLRMMHLANLSSVQLTNAPGNKDKPAIVSGRVVWTDIEGADSNNPLSQARIGSLPDLQPVFNNRNMIAVTAGLLGYKTSAAELLTLWNQQAGVIEITRYNQLLPSLQSQSVSWVDDAVSGDDFTLNEGDFLWVKFNSSNILDFAASACTPEDLVIGVNVLTSACIPDDYDAYRMIRELGAANVNSVRILDSQSGRWQVASVNGSGVITGENFDIPSIAVILIDMSQAVSQWLPGE